MKALTLLILVTSVRVASAAPLVCRAPEEQRAQVEALRVSYRDDPIFRFATRASGEPTRCTGEHGKDEAARLTFVFSDGSSFEVVRAPPESGRRVYRSRKPIADVAAVLKLLREEVKDVRWSHHDDDKSEPGVVKRSYFVPDTNLRVFLYYRGTALVGFGDAFAL
jgi:hypothetical protein